MASARKRTSPRHATAAKAAAPAIAPTVAPTSAATAAGLPATIGGFAIFASIDGAAGQDPVQAAMDAAVSEHNAAVIAEQAAARAAKAAR